MHTNKEMPANFDLKDQRNKFFTELIMFLLLMAGSLHLYWSKPNGHGVSFFCFFTGMMLIGSIVLMRLKLILDVIKTRRLEKPLHDRNEP